MSTGDGSPGDPWTLATPSGQSEFQAYRDETLDPPALVVQVGKTELRYQLRCIDDLHAMLVASTATGCPWAAPTSRSPRAEGTVEAWGRARGQPRRRLVRTQEGPSRPLRQLRAARAGAARPGRGRAQRPQQPDARADRPASAGCDPLPSLEEPLARERREVVAGGDEGLRQEDAVDAPVVHGTSTSSAASPRRAAPPPGDWRSPEASDVRPCDLLRTVGRPARRLPVAQ